MTSPKTIRVRIAVAVTPNGCWDTRGMKLLPEWDNETDEEAARLVSGWLFGKQGPGHVVFIEADVPVPESVTVEGTVTP